MKMSMILHSFKVEYFFARPKNIWPTVSRPLVVHESSLQLGLRQGSAHLMMSWSFSLRVLCSSSSSRSRSRAPPAASFLRRFVPVQVDSELSMPAICDSQRRAQSRTEHQRQHTDSCSTLRWTTLAGISLVLGACGGGLWIIFHNTHLCA